MVAQAALAIVAVIALVGGTVAAGESGVFNTANAGNVNLGTLAPGANGTVSATTSVTIANSSEYKIQKTMEDRIGSVFSMAQVSVTINGHTYNLSKDQGESKLQLNNGTYKVTLNFAYQVRQNALPANLSKVAFLFLQPIENDSFENESENHGNLSEVGDNSGNQSLNVNETNDSSQNATSFEQGNSSSAGDNNSQRVVLFTMTLKVNGNTVNQGEHETEASNKTEDSTLSL